MQIANGTGLADTDMNWTFRSSLGAVRRIDYILYSAGFATGNALVTWELDLGSDHRNVKASFSFMPRHMKEKRPVRITRGWKHIFNRDGIAREFHDNINVQMTSCASGSLGNLQTILRDAASITTSSEQAFGGGSPEKSIANSPMNQMHN